MTRKGKVDQVPGTSDVLLFETGDIHVEVDAPCAVDNGSGFAGDLVDGPCWKTKGFLAQVCRKSDGLVLLLLCKTVEVECFVKCVKNTQGAGVQAVGSDKTVDLVDGGALDECR